MIQYITYNCSGCNATVGHVFEGQISDTCLRKSRYINLVCNTVPIINSSTTCLWGEASPQNVLVHHILSVAGAPAAAGPVTLLQHNKQQSNMTATHLGLNNHLNVCMPTINYIMKILHQNMSIMKHYNCNSNLIQI